MSKILEIKELGNPVIRTTSEVVKNIKSNEIQELIDDMTATVKEANGVGLAAPQVGESLRIFIIDSRPNERYPDAPKFGPLAMINPKIISKSESKEKEWEGCLSIPGIRGHVPRYRSLEVEYFTRDGEHHRKILEGFPAKVFQHELDHLDGIIFLDRLCSMNDVVTEKEFAKMMKSA